MSRFSIFRRFKSHGNHAVMVIESALDHLLSKQIIDSFRQIASRVLVVEPQQWEEGRGQRVTEFNGLPGDLPGRLVAQVRPIPDFNPNDPLEPWKTAP
jgi:hypothetical protein